MKKIRKYIYDHPGLYSSIDWIMSVNQFISGHKLLPIAVGMLLGKSDETIQKDHKIAPDQYDKNCQRMNDIMSHAIWLEKKGYQPLLFGLEYCPVGDRHHVSDKPEEDSHRNIMLVRLSAKDDVYADKLHTEVTLRGVSFIEGRFCVENNKGEREFFAQEELEEVTHWAYIEMKPDWSKCEYKGTQISPITGTSETKF